MMFSCSEIFLMLMLVMCVHLLALLCESVYTYVKMACHTDIFLLIFFFIQSLTEFERIDELKFHTGQHGINTFLEDIILLHMFHKYFLH
jgi:hypothetical protein